MRPTISTSCMAVCDDDIEYRSGDTIVVLMHEKAHGQLPCALHVVSQSGP